MLTHIRTTLVHLLPVVGVLASATWCRADGPGLHGRVLALDEQGLYQGVVAGATIEFLDQGGGSAARATTGANGYYRVDLGAGAYTYNVTAPGYKSDDKGRGLEIRRGDGYVVQDFSLVQGEDDADAAPPNVAPVPLGRLTGRVFEVLEDNRRVGVPRARIALRPADTGRLRKVFTRDAQRDPSLSGGYAVHLPAGTWRAAVSADGFETLIDPQPIDIPANGEATRDFILRRTTPETPAGQGIRGIVLWPQDAARPRIELRIEPLKRPGGGQPAPVLDAQGRFTHDVREGSYRLVANAPGYHPAGRAPVTVFPGRYTDVMLRLSPLTPESPTEPEPPARPLRVAVTVKERTATALAPVAKARVLLRRDGEELGDAQRAETGANGEAAFDVTAEGSYAVLAQATGFKPGGLKVQVSAGGPNRADVILFRDTPDVESTLVAVTGYVAFKDETSPTGYRGVPGTRLIWRDSVQSQPVQTADTDARGAFRVEVPAGRYEIELQPPRGFRGAREPLTVAAGMAAKTLVVEPIRGDDAPARPARDVQVSGVVVGASAVGGARYASVADAVVAWDGRQTDKTVRSDLSGRVSVSLPEGLYQVRVQARGYEPLEQSVLVQPGMAAMRFVLARGGGQPGGGQPGGGQPGRMALNVRVMQRITATQRGTALLAPTATRPLANADVTVLQGGNAVARGRSDEEGRYSVQLPPGRYDVRAAREGFVEDQKPVALVNAAASAELTLAPQANTGRPPAGKHTLTLRVVEQTAAQPDPGTPTPPRTPRRGRTPGAGDNDATDKDTQKSAPGSALQQLQDRMQRRGGRDRKPPDQGATVSALAGANVSVMRGNKAVAQGTTDQNGLYRVGLDSGAYTVVVSLRGYDTAQQLVQIGNSDVSRQVVLSKTVLR